MKIQAIRTLAGANVYSHHPAILMRLDLEELAETESLEKIGFNERLLELLPGLREHTCSKGRAGGFVERLAEGTYFGHVVEHVALELMELAGVGKSHGKTRYSGTPGVYNVVVEYDCEDCTRHLLRAAVEVVEGLLRGERVSYLEAIREAKRINAKTAMGPSTKSIVEAATRRGIPWRRLNDAGLVQLGYGKHRKHIQAAMTSETNAVAVEVAGDKELTKTLLEAASIIVPRGRLVRSEEAAIEASEEIGAPVVVKPLDGRQGKGVSLNLTTPEEVCEAFRIARVFPERARRRAIRGTQLSRDLRRARGRGERAIAVSCHGRRHTYRKRIDRDREQRSASWRRARERFDRHHA